MLASCAWAQDAAEVFSKPPAEVDEALRARVAKFYQAQVDGKARHAEEIVAEDSKDFFYNMAKPKFLSFEIRSIKYSDNFTKATVTMVMEMYLMMPGFEGKPMKIPGPTYWKVENGQWCWYIDPDIMNTTPFGKLKDSGVPASGAATPPDLRSAPTPQTVTRQVRPDKLRASLMAGAPSSDQIKIHNGMPGTVRIELHHAEVRGLEIKLDRTEIAAGENAVMSFHFEPGHGLPPSHLEIEVGVEPINSILRFLVVFN